MVAAQMGFYPADTARATALLEALLAPALAQRPDGPPPRAAIAPHAGYRYSGATAATALAPLAAGGFDRVLLIGPSHRAHVEGIALSSAAAFATPFGRVPVDQAATDALIAADPLFHIDDSGHAQEHGLEVELPFLHHLVPDFRIVPMVVLNRHLDRAAVQRAARVLADTVLDDHTVLVVSSDFTHYGERFGYTPFPVAEAPRRLPELDGGAMAAITAGDPAAFQDYVAATGATICGATAIAIALELDRYTGAAPCYQRRAYTTSGALTGDFHASVSYAALTR